jgi:hypothetical protein
MHFVILVLLQGTNTIVILPPFLVLREINSRGMETDEITIIRPLDVKNDKAKLGWKT